MRTLHPISALLLLLLLSPLHCNILLIHTHRTYYQLISLNHTSIRPQPADNGSENGPFFAQESGVKLPIKIARQMYWDILILAIVGALKNFNLSLARLPPKATQITLFRRGVGVQKIDVPCGIWIIVLELLPPWTVFRMSALFSFYPFAYLERFFFCSLTPKCWV